MNYIQFTKKSRIKTGIFFKLKIILKFVIAETRKAPCKNSRGLRYFFYILK